MYKATYIEDMNNWRSRFKFHSPIKVRFGETDMFGHLNNANALVYFEEARIEYFKHIGLEKKWKDSMENKKLINVVANIQCDFIRQIYFDEKLKIYTKIHKIGRSSFDLHYMTLSEDNEISLTGSNTIVQIHKDTGRSSPLTTEIRDLLISESV